MANIEDLKKIRQMTGVSIDAIKKALEEADGKIDQALKFLKERGISVAAKKAERETGEGFIFSYIHGSGKIGVMVKLFCETDFVARNDEFRNLGHELAMHITAMNPADVEELLGQPYVRDQDTKIDSLIKNYISKLGENIRIGEFCRFEI
ncbi:MAG: translation elongation factor Ts [Candidatus Azambacteria bacterium]|nr:translation elongation factor Ts [Candidatus Azambacteria bacterium]